MDEGRRPGGLTALAVLNFVGSGIDVLIVIWLLATFAFASSAADTAERQLKERAAKAHPEKGGPDKVTLTEEERRSVDAVRKLQRSPLLGTMAGLVVVCGGLLVAAGVGYLRQRRWGRLLGNVYAIVSLASSAAWIRLMPEEMGGGGFRFFALFFLMYPVATLFLLNTTFREDLRS